VYIGGLIVVLSAICDRQIGAAELPSFVFAEAGVEVSRLLTKSFESFEGVQLAYRHQVSRMTGPGAQ
jgi:hypothetical protein